MGEKDVSTKYLESYNDVFADIFNVLMFHEDYIEETLLLDGPTETQYKVEAGNLNTHHRDCIKYYKDTGLACITFGIENQATVDKTMPVRIKPFVNDYPIHVIDVKRIPKRIRRQLKSDFKVVADFFAEKEKKNYTPSTEAITHPEAVLHMIEVFTGDSSYARIKEGITEDAKKGKVITMCDFAQRMLQQGKQEGIQEGETLVVNAILALKSGKTIDELKETYSEHTLTLAQQCI